MRAARLVAVDLEHPVEMAHVEADGARVSAAEDRLDAAHDRGASAERNDRDLLSARPVEHGRDVGFALRQGDKIGRVGEIAVKRAHGFGKGFAVGMQEALVGVVRQHAAERRRGRDARRAQRDLGGLRRRSGCARLDAELLADETEEALALGVREAVALIAPAVEFEPLAHGKVPPRRL